MVERAIFLWLQWSRHSPVRKGIETSLSATKTYQPFSGADTAPLGRGLKLQDMPYSLLRLEPDGADTAPLGRGLKLLDARGDRADGLRDGADTAPLGRGLKQYKASGYNLRRIRSRHSPVRKGIET